MAKKFGYSLLIVGLLMVQLAVFGAVETVDDVTVWVEAQALESTDGVKEDIVEKVMLQLDLALTKAPIDGEGKTSLKNLNAMMTQALMRLDAGEAVDVMDTYADVVTIYMGAGRMSVKDVQWATNEFIDLMGDNVTKAEGVNVSRTEKILEKIAKTNMLVQGAYSVSLNQTVKVSDVNQLILDIEKAYRVTTSELSIYKYNTLARELQKPLVLKTSGDAVNVTITKDLLKKIVAGQMAIIVEENGFTYNIPAEFTKMHVGDFKISINNTALETAKAKGETVHDGSLEFLVAKDVKIGYATNKTPVGVQISEKLAIGANYVKAPYTVLQEDAGKWVKCPATSKCGLLDSSISGTGVIGLAKYAPTYTDLVGHWSEMQTTTLLARGIADRVNKSVFEPNSSMTRGELARMLINIVGTEDKSVNEFTDVPAGSPYADIIESAIYYGFTSNIQGKEFAADTAITREELVTLVARMYEVKYGYPLESGFLRFKDMNDIAPHAKEAVAAMKDAGFIDGYDDNTFRPKNPVTRAEAVAVIYKVLGEK